MNDMDSPKLSIIIPVYNARDTIEKCVRSVQQQTLKDIEIILVFNGEDGDSFEICDKLQKGDDRLRLIRSEKTGAAAARNLGIDASEGEYIGFVDADDLIEPDMFDVLLSALSVNKSDIVVCEYYEEIKGRSTRKELPFVGTRSKEEVMRVIATGELENFLWNKVFKATLFDGIRMPERVIFEDASIIYRLVDKSRSITLIDRPLYHYEKESSGLIGEVSIGKRLDSFDFFDEFYSFLKDRYGSIVSESGRFLYGLCITFASSYVRSDSKLRKKHRAVVQEHFAEYKKEKIILNKKLTLPQRAAMKFVTTVSIPGCYAALLIELVRRKVFDRPR